MLFWDSALSCTQNAREKSTLSLINITLIEYSFKTEKGCLLLLIPQIQPPFSLSKQESIEYSMINETSNKQSTHPNLDKFVKRVLFCYWNFGQKEYSLDY